MRHPADGDAWEPDLDAGRARTATALRKIGHALDVPVQAFYGPPAADDGAAGIAELEVARLLALVEACLRRIDPEARRRFGDAVQALAANRDGEAP